MQVAKDKKMEKLRLCYVHNVPNNPVFIDVDSVKKAIDIKIRLFSYHPFK